MLVVGRCGVWCAGLDRAGPGGAACRLLAALRGRRSVQIVTSAGKYVVTKFPLQISRYSSQLWSDALQKYALSPRHQQIAAHRCDHAQANIRHLGPLPRQKLPGGSRRLWPRPGSDRRLQLRPGGGQLQQLGRVHVRGPVHCEPLPLRRRDTHPGQRQPVLRGG